MNKAFDINALLKKDSTGTRENATETKQSFTFLIFIDDKERMEELRVYLAKKKGKILSQADLLVQGIELMSNEYPSVGFEPNSFKFKGGRKKLGEEVYTTSFRLLPRQVNFLNNMIEFKLKKDIHYTKRYLFKEIMDILENELKVNPKMENKKEL